MNSLVKLCCIYCQVFYYLNHNIFFSPYMSDNFSDHVKMMGVLPWGFHLKYTCFSLLLCYGAAHIWTSSYKCLSTLTCQWLAHLKFCVYNNNSKLSHWLRLNAKISCTIDIKTEHSGVLFPRQIHDANQSKLSMSSFERQKLHQAVEGTSPRHQRRRWHQMSFSALFSFLLALQQQAETRCTETGAPRNLFHYCKGFSRSQDSCSSLTFA